jgi:tRNA nucleotidyltransferase (CCA-adding enzyme)
VIRELCEQYGFTINDATFTVQKDVVYIILQPRTRTISKTTLHTGPPVTLKKNADDFLKKWRDNPRTIKEPYEKDKRWYVEIEREFTDLRRLLEDQVNNLSLGKNVDRAILKDRSIVTIKELLVEDLRLFWSSYLDHRMTWER